MIAPDAGDVIGAAVPGHPRHAAPGLQRFLRHRLRVRRVGGAVERQLDRRSGLPRPLCRLDRDVDALRPQHPGDDRDLQRRLRRQRLRAKPLGIDAGAAEDRHARGVAGVEPDERRIVRVLEQVAGLARLEAAHQHARRDPRAAPDEVLAGAEEAEAGERVDPARNARHQRRGAADQDRAQARCNARCPAATP